MVSDGCAAYHPFPMRDACVIHYDEIALKGGIRRRFEQQLMETLRTVGGAHGRVEVRRLFGRMLVLPEDPTVLHDLAQDLSLVPGVRYVLTGRATGDAWEEIVAAVGSLLPEGDGRTFGVRVRRADKSYPVRSGELAARLGAWVLERRPWRVDLTEPELWIRVELVNRRALVSTRRYEGAGGLPVGASGRAVTLLSGGIDSPVAAWMMMTRGLALTLVHCHSAPYTSRASQDKVRELAQCLTRFQPRIDLLMVPFADPIQAAIVERTPARYRVVLYRRFMLRMALEAGARRRAKAVVTGEALGQVASQTIENMTAVQAIATLPVLRPLVGLGKASIIERARRIGTYEISIQPHEDCCSYLMPRNPATRTSAAELDEVERSLDIEGLVEQTWAATERIVVRAAKSSPESGTADAAGRAPPRQEAFGTDQDPGS